MPRYNQRFASGSVVPDIVAPDLSGATALLDEAAKGFAKAEISAEKRRALESGAVGDFRVSPVLAAINQGAAENAESAVRRVHVAQVEGQVNLLWETARITDGDKGKPAARQAKLTGFDGAAQSLLEGVPDEETRAVVEAQINGMRARLQGANARLTAQENDEIAAGQEADARRKRINVEDDLIANGEFDEIAEFMSAPPPKFENEAEANRWHNTRNAQMNSIRQGVPARARFRQVIQSGLPLLDTYMHAVSFMKNEAGIVNPEAQISAIMLEEATEIGRGIYIPADADIEDYAAFGQEAALAALGERAKGLPNADVIVREVARAGSETAAAMEYQSPSIRAPVSAFSGEVLAQVRGDVGDGRFTKKEWDEFKARWEPVITEQALTEAALHGGDKATRDQFTDAANDILPLVGRLVRVDGEPVISQLGELELDSRAVNRAVRDETDGIESAINGKGNPVDVAKGLTGLMTRADGKLRRDSGRVQKAIGNIGAAMSVIPTLMGEERTTPAEYAGSFPVGEQNIALAAVREQTKRTAAAFEPLSHYFDPITREKLSQSGVRILPKYQIGADGNPTNARIVVDVSEFNRMSTGSQAEREAKGRAAQSGLTLLEDTARLAPAGERKSRADLYRENPGVQILARAAGVEDSWSPIEATGIQSIYSRAMLQGPGISDAPVSQYLTNIANDPQMAGPVRRALQNPSFQKGGWEWRTGPDGARVLSPMRDASGANINLFPLVFAGDLGTDIAAYSDKGGKPDNQQTARVMGEKAVMKGFQEREAGIVDPRTGDYFAPADLLKQPMFVVSDDARGVSGGVSPEKQTALVALAEADGVKLEYYFAGDRTYAMMVSKDSGLPIRVGKDGAQVVWALRGGKTLWEQITDSRDFPPHMSP